MPTFTGTPGADILTGTEGNDVLNGGDGNDLLDGLGGIDQLFGGNGDDELRAVNLPLPGGGHTLRTFVATLFDGGAGFDTLAVGGVTTFRGSLISIEGISLLPRLDNGTTTLRDEAHLTLDEGTFAGLPANLRLSGLGSVRFNLQTGQYLDASSFTFAPQTDAYLIFSGSAVASGATGSARDDLFIAGNGNDLFDGGGAHDIISYQAAPSGVTVDLSIVTAQNTGGSGVDTLQNFESLMGSFFNDVLTSGQATASILGGNGNDTIVSAYDNGWYYGEAGDDTITASGVQTRSFGGDGNDTLNVAGFADGGAGNDILNMSDVYPYNAIAFGGDGDDTLNGSASSGTLIGGNGADSIYGNDGDDILVSGGADSFAGRDFGTIRSADAGTEHDRLFGGSGNDRLSGGYGDDVDGGTGTNSLELSLIGASAGVTLNSASLTTGGPFVLGGGTITNIQSVVALWGSNFADSLTIAAPAALYGMGGNDTLNGSSGADEIHGGAGADLINAGGGDDRIVLDQTDDAVPGEIIDGGSGYDVVVNSNPPLGATNYDYDLSGATLIGIERIESFVGRIGLAPSQLSGVHSYSGLFYLTAGGAAAITGSTSTPVSFNLSAAGNTLDLTGFTGSSFVDVNGDIGNDLIRGSAGSDNLRGGGGNDVIVGGGGVDNMVGGAGDDLFRDTVAGLNGDIIHDFTFGDHIVISDTTLAGFNASLRGTSLSFSGGTIQLANSPGGRLSVTAAAGGGVDIQLVRYVANDFNGDGRSDILWRNVDGAVGDWLGDANGNFAVNSAVPLRGVPLAWHIAGTGDFNGDGRSDILWRNDSGAVGDWLGTATGDFTVTGVLINVPNEWKIAGTGDFNGDGKTDILWRNASGTIGNWLGTTDGNFAITALSVPVSNDWKIVGTGDFNGDGRTDILWRSIDGRVGDWLGNAGGGFDINPSPLIGVPNEWKVAGTGDFNGDGRSDILWRNDDGRIGDWLGTATGGFTVTSLIVAVPNEWHVAATGDYNGDGRDDILWRNDNGAVGNWLGNPGGDFTINGGLYQVPTSWHVQPDGLL